MAIRSDDILQGKTSQSIVHTYQIAGSEVNRKTQTSNLQQKVAEAKEIAMRQEAEQPLKVTDELEDEN